MPCSARDQCRVKRAGRLLPVLLCSLATSYAHADEAYELGIQAFNRGSYADAVAYFLTSSDTSDPGLHYNLGVSYYKLGRYEEAGQSFLKVTESPELAAMGYYNLALVAARLNQPVLVTDWLQHAIESTDNPKLLALAHAMLERYPPQEDAENVHETLASAAASNAPWSGFLVGETGYDSNVILRSDSQTLSTSDQDDTFVDVYGYANRRLGTLQNGLELNLDGNIYVIKYQDIEDYNIDSLRVGGLAGMDFHGWRAESGVHLAYTFLDGHEFTLEPQFNVSANRWMQNGRSRLRLRYELSRINTLDTLYAYLNGWRHKTDARITWIHGDQKLHVMYQLETNYREELSSPLYTSYSPIRNSLRFIAESPVGSLLEATLELQYHHSHFMNPNELADGSLVTRRDDRITGIARLTHRFTGGNEVSLEYRRSNNESNLDEYDYTQYLTMLGLLLAF
jgi:tetratricopeptide (TPR) repeat protein